MVALCLAAGILRAQDVQRPLIVIQRQVPAADWALMPQADSLCASLRAELTDSGFTVTTVPERVAAIKARGSIPTATYVLELWIGRADSTVKVQARTIDVETSKSSEWLVMPIREAADVVGRLVGHFAIAKVRPSGHRSP